MEYKFYVKMDGETFGPYSAREIRDLQLMDDILVTEESMDEWLPAGRFDFDDMVRKEFGSCVNEDGSINRSQYNTLVNSSTSQQTQQTRSTTTSTTTEGVPNEIKKWNWGAFFFNWLWGVCNGVYWPLILILVNIIPYVGQIISFIGCIALGLNGNEWAWKAKSWSNVEEFKRVQHNWSMAVLWVIGISLGLVFFVAIANS